jgi:hypothetical protein
MTEFEQEVFEYLDDLRESGEANMYGASSYVQEEFGLDKREARDLCIKWRLTFEERHPEV